MRRLNANEAPRQAAWISAGHTFVTLVFTASYCVKRFPKAAPVESARARFVATLQQTSEVVPQRAGNTVERR